MIMIIWISVIAINVVIIWSLISSSSCSKSQQTQPSIFPKPSRLCSCLHIVGTIFALAYISGCFVIVQYDLISWYFIMIITIIIINMKKNISPHLLLLKSHHAHNNQNLTMLSSWSDRNILFSSLHWLHKDWMQTMPDTLQKSFEFVFICHRCQRHTELKDVKGPT